MSICSNRNPDNPHYSKRIGLREYCCGELGLDYFKGPNVQKNFTDSEYFRHADNNEIPQCRGWWSSHATELDLITLKEIHQLQKTYDTPEVIRQATGSILTCTPDKNPRILSYFDGNKKLEKIVCSEESKSLMIDDLPGCYNNICFVENNSPNYSLVKNPPVNNVIINPILGPSSFALFGATGGTGSTGSTGSSSNTGLIIGIIIGVVVLLILIGVGLYFLLRKKPTPVVQQTTTTKTTTVPAGPNLVQGPGPVESSSVFTTRIVNTPGYRNYQPITYSGIDNTGGLTVYKTGTIPSIL